MAAGIVLEVGDDAYLGIACWGTGSRWAVFTVPVAYATRYETCVRPQMPGNPISLATLQLVARARANYADYATGRNSRPTNDRLAADTGLSVRTIQRADTALRLLGIATEILRGRQRTRTERFAAWRLGDRYRGWASVWALHDDPRIAQLVSALSPHLRSGPQTNTSAVDNRGATGPGGPAGHRQRGAARRAKPSTEGMRLAAAWRTDPHAPPWARRHTPTAWAAILAAPAHAGWTPRDLNQLVTDWLTTAGRRIPDTPHKPIGLLGAMLAWHTSANPLSDRPAALDEAREAEALAAHRAHLAAQHAARTEHHHGRETGRTALNSPGHTAARTAAATAARNAATRRTHTAAADTANHIAAVAAARQPRTPRHQ